jgi:hypothetical protein
MDIAGAKALKERLGSNAADDAPPDSADVRVPEDAPPVYHWTGVSDVPARPSSGDVDETSATDVSLFSRLGFSFR